MQSFKMILNGSEKATVKSKVVNQPKLDWFMKEIEKCGIPNDSINTHYIKIYKSNIKTFEIYLSKDSIDELSLEWINYKK